MSEIALRDVWKKYDNDVTAVDNFNLTIHDNEFVIFVGPSGCGKSTTLRMIAGLEEITAGNLLIDGEKMNEVPSYDRNIAMVFQNYALYPHMTVYDNIAYSMKLAKCPKEEIREKVLKAAETLGLTEVLKRKPGELSGGQKQRVAIGRAIVRKPKAFLMDEPLSNLDAKLRAEMRIQIQKLYHELKTTFIYVTHDQVEAMTLGTKIVVMKDGVMRQVGTPSELYNNPANKFVAGFIGTPQMNFLEAVCMEAEGRIVLVYDGQEITVGEENARKLRQKGYVGKKLTVGIRPEDIYVDEEHLEAYKDSVIEETVEVYELLGAEVILYFEHADVSLTAKVSADTEAKRGQRMKLALDPERIHFFDADTESAI